MPAGAPRVSAGEDTKKLSVNLPESLYEELEALAKSESRSLSYLDREAIKQYLFLNQARKR
ncbi:ribbon-helix-helix domain-containing protein [Streptomyces sp. P9(2023)]|uniref:ribbon-helix-helix domain-containing protein n=1 Tax=Streptomyces sp. P9(2023) TaxID=3064394 RepID=UPI0037DD8891